MSRLTWIQQLAIVLVVTSLAMPARLWIAFGPFASASFMDLVLILGGSVLTLEIIVRRNCDVGHPVIFGLLCIPFLLGSMSLAWSQDVAVSIKWVFIMAESLIAYLIAVRLYTICPSRTILGYMGLFVVLCLAGSVLSLLHVPGFEVTVPPEYPMGSSEYVVYLYTYYGRLSNPFIGLSNALARALVSYVPVFFVWAVLSRSRSYYILAFVTVLAIAFTLSRGVLVSFAMTTLLLLSRHELRKYLPWLGAAIGLVSLTIYSVYAWEPETGATLIERTSDSNVQARAQKFTIGLEKITERPLAGYGAGVAAAGDDRLVGGSHNILVDMMLYFGIIPGLFVCISLVAVPIAFFGWPTEDFDVRLMRSAIGYAVVCQLLGFLSESAFDTSVLRVQLYFFIGSSVALLRAMAVDRQHSVSNGTQGTVLL